jgi:glycosyltransferase involved in cell wall biosynthesis
MKIAQVAPLYESVPPKLYGGTERVVYYLTEELIRQGHDVTLFASGDSQTNARLIVPVEDALRLKNGHYDPIAYHVILLQDIIERADDFDVIHFHIDYLHFPFSQLTSTPHLTTLHGRLDLPELQDVYNKFPDQPVVSISNNQRGPLPQANWIGTVYHGLPDDLLSFGEGKGNYLAFLGRISPEKGLEKAIEWAKAANMKLKIAAKVDEADKKYFETEIKHLLNDPLIEYIGEINEEEKKEFLGNALALLFPINWCEPFGMVMIEAMSCGTPIVAFGMGSVPEVIDKGKTGFIVKDTTEAVKVISRLPDFSREGVRKTFEDRFTAERMTKDYVKLYLQLNDEKDRQLSSSNFTGGAITIRNEGSFRNKAV